MIFLQRIDIERFKGVNRVCCEFDALTLLGGLNNSGKTTVLQAVYLVTHFLPTICNHPGLTHENPRERSIDISPPTQKLGMPSWEWLVHEPQSSFKICATFRNGLSVTIFREPNGAFCFSVAAVDESNPQTLLAEIQDVSAEFFRPPGLISSSEQMLAYPNYLEQVGQGRGNTYWRNNIWWLLQRMGLETFEPVRAIVQQYFPDVEMLLPTVGTAGNPPPIQIRYRERDKRPLDIAQSGGGLQTFLSLAQLVVQSNAAILLLDEPDTHLHASQQAVVVKLLMDLAEGERQIIFATHAPEMISRVPAEAIRWLQANVETAEGGLNATVFLDRLGASPDAYITKSNCPEILVYVEGATDKPVVEALIDWCRQRSRNLPRTKVIRHTHGRFEAGALQGIVRFLREMSIQSRVVGIRDLDYRYDDFSPLPPTSEPAVDHGQGYDLVTLPCKELENLICDSELLAHAIDRSGEHRELLEHLLAEESLSPGLVDDWKYQARPQLRSRHAPKVDDATSERLADEEFSRWQEDVRMRCRFVSGKQLLARVRASLQARKLRISSSAAQIIRTAPWLTPIWLDVANAIFPGAVFDQNVHPPS